MLKKCYIPKRIVNILKNSYKTLAVFNENDVETVRIEGSTVDVYWNNLNWLNNVRESGLSDCVWKISLCDPTTKADEEYVDFFTLTNIYSLYLKK